jgi:hypothetical protein
MTTMTTALAVFLTRLGGALQPRHPAPTPAPPRAFRITPIVPVAPAAPVPPGALCKDGWRSSVPGGHGCCSSHGGMK